MTETNITVPVIYGFYYFLLFLTLYLFIFDTFHQYSTYAVLLVLNTKLQNLERFGLDG